MFRRLIGEERGATIVEFALVTIPLTTIMCGLFDLGYRQYVAVQLQDALDQAARQVTVGTSTTTAQLNQIVTNKIRPVANNATVSVVPTSYDTFAHVAKPEPITTDTAPLGKYNAGDCFLDINGNGVWDADAGKGGTGGSDDIVVYTATVTYPAIMPMFGLLGWSKTETVTSTAMMKNQPYASQPQPATICS
ncbi:MAG: TadE/TadG family type IV pilus assembly protein [Sphingomonas sp.]